MLCQYDESKAFWTMVHANALMEGYWEPGHIGVEEDVWVVSRAAAPHGLPDCCVGADD